MMKNTLLLILLLPLFILITSPGAIAQSASDKTDLKNLLDEFLMGASENNAEIHDRFWAEDLIYTSSGGQRFGKAEIMEGLQAADPNGDTIGPVYHAEEVTIRQYKSMAIVAFRLVATTETPGGVETDYFYNTGTFLQRDGMWQVVAWQATRIP